MSSIKFFVSFFILLSALFILGSSFPSFLSLDTSPCMSLIILSAFERSFFWLLSSGIERATVLQKINIPIESIDIKKIWTAKPYGCVLCGIRPQGPRRDDGFAYQRCLCFSALTIAMISGAHSLLLSLRHLNSQSTTGSSVFTPRNFKHLSTVACSDPINGSGSFTSRCSMASFFSMLSASYHILKLSVGGL